MFQETQRIAGPNGFPEGSLGNDRSRAGRPGKLFPSCPVREREREKKKRKYEA